jgi:hypothetical protein
MAQIHVAVDTPVAAEDVLGAAIDFSSHRLEVWPTIDPAVYRVVDQGDHCAVVREGSDVFGGIWAEEQYDWSEPGVVRATIRDSNTFVTGGTWELRAKPDGEGTHVELIWHREGKGLKGHLVVAGMRVAGARRLRDGLKQTLDIVAAHDLRPKA